jgi:regulator of CtrA degradation
MLARRLTDSLYVEAMVLADEARAYFDASYQGGRQGDERGRELEALEPFDRVLFSCESLKVTTRLMHIVAWLLTQRAVDAGELSPDEVREPSRRLGPAVASDDDGIERLPEGARRLIETSVDLYRRVERLDNGFGDDSVATSPARHLLHRLSQSF